MPRAFLGRVMGIVLQLRRRQRESIAFYRRRGPSNEQMDYPNGDTEFFASEFVQ